MTRAAPPTPADTAPRPFRPAAVLFDCDGVLVDSEPATRVLLAQSLTDHGLPMTPEGCHDLFVGGTIHGVAAEARRRGATLPDDWVPAFYQQMFAHLAQGTALIPGADALTAALVAAGIPIAVGSNGPPRKMKVTLGQHPALRGRFGPHVHSAQVVGRPKPEPDVYLHAARQLGVDPRRCVVVEDSATGARAAAAAEMRCYGLALDDDGAALAAAGAVVVRSMAALHGWFCLPE